MKKENFKIVNRVFFLTAILYILLGIIMLLWHERVTEVIGYVIAGGLLVIGGGYIFAYFFKDVAKAMEDNDLVVGILSIIAGIYAFINVRAVMGVIPVILGFAIVFSALLKIQEAVDAMRTGYEKWWIILVVALVTLILGILILANPFETAATLIMLIGISLIIAGLTDIIVPIRMAGIFKSFIESREEDE